MREMISAMTEVFGPRVPSADQLENKPGDYKIVIGWCNPVAIEKPLNPGFVKDGIIGKAGYTDGCGIPT